MYLAFRSDGSVSYTGFHLEYKGTLKPTRLSLPFFLYFPPKLYLWLCNYLLFWSVFVVDWQQNCVRHVLIQAIWWMALVWVLTTSWAPWWHFIARLATCSRATPRWNVSWAAAGDPSGTEPNQAVKVRGNSVMLTEAPASQTSTLQLFGHYWIPGYNRALLR